MAPYGLVSRPLSPKVSVLHVFARTHDPLLVIGLFYLSASSCCCSLSLTLIDLQLLRTGPCPTLPPHSHLRLAVPSRHCLHHSPSHSRPVSRLRGAAATSIEYSAVLFLLAPYVASVPVLVCVCLCASVSIFSRCLLPLPLPLTRSQKRAKELAERREREKRVVIEKDRTWVRPGENWYLISTKWLSAYAFLFFSFSLSRFFRSRYSNSYEDDDTRLRKYFWLSIRMMILI